MSKSKKKKKKKQKDRSSPTSSAHESHDESSKEKEYSKTKETSKKKHTSYVRPIPKEAGRSRQLDSHPSPQKNFTESSSSARQYKKPVYRLATVSHLEKEKDHSKVKVKHPTSRSSHILENTSRKTHSIEKRHLETPASGEPVRKRVSEELSEERKKLVKRRSKEALECTSFLPRCLGKSTKQQSQEPRSKPAVFSETASISTKVSKVPHTYSESSKPSGNDQEEKQGLKAHNPVQFKIPKKTKIVVNKIWKNSALTDYTESVTQKVSRHSPQTDDVLSGCTFLDRKSIKEKAKPRCEVKPAASDFVNVLPDFTSSQPTQRCTEVGKNKETVTALKTTALPGKAQSPRVPSKATDTYDDDLEVITELHQARTQKLLDVKVVDSYGELTSMDIDPPEEIKAFSFSKEDIQQDLLIILDTNILLSHLDFVKKMRTHGLGALGFPHVLIPWVVMQELDSLKQGKLSTNVEHKARPAVRYIYTALKNQEPRLWGQSMQQASLRIYGLDAESNDDRVLHCCLQYQGLYPGAALILCTDDKNLCSKALLSGVKALSKADLECEVNRLQSATQAHSHQSPPVSWSPHTAEDQIRSQSPNGSENNRSEAADEARQVSTSVSVLEEALKEASSLILESEMKAAYDDLWLEVVLVKPPWTLNDLLLCFKKHWIAVFGSIVERSLLSSVECLSDTLCKGKIVDGNSVKLAAREAHHLVHAFRCRLNYGKNLSKPLAVLEQLLEDTSQSARSAEQTSGTHPLDSDGDILMAMEEEASDAQPSYQEVWAVFENIWANVCQISSAVFTALRFIPGTLETGMPSDGPPPPEEALACLHKLIFTVKQLLESLQRVLSSKSSFEDVQALLAFLRSSEIVSVKPSFSAEDLLECLSQQEYREKLCVGGNQLMDLSASLDRCALAVGQRAGSSSWS